MVQKTLTFTKKPKDLSNNPEVGANISNILAKNCDIYKLNKFILVVVLSICVATTHAQDFITHVTLTTYNPCKAQCDDSPTITANNTKINLHKLKQGKLKYCAVSPDLLWCLPFGSIIEIDGHGMYEVVDTMNKRFDHYIDILQDKSKPNFKKEKIKIKLIRKGKKVLNKC